MAHFSELKTRQRLMDDFIRRSATGDGGVVDLEVRLFRETKARTETGGTEVTSTISLPPQTFGIMALKRRQTDEGAFTDPSRGRDSITDMQLIFIASLDADIQKGDWFRWERDDHIRQGIYRIEYVGVKQSDRKLVGFYFHAELD